MKPILSHFFRGGGEREIEKKAVAVCLTKCFHVFQLMTKSLGIGLFFVLTSFSCHHVISMYLYWHIYSLE